MKVKFNGLLEKKPGGGGCNCKKSSNGYGFTSSRMYILPSGQQKTFFAGKVEEVSERDGNFLLSYNVTDANGTRKVFEKVED